jgi:hypothetical protein
MVNTLYLAAAGTASLDFRDAGNIVGVTISTNSAAIGSIEVSFNSSSSFATNDTTGVIAGAVVAASGLDPAAFYEMTEPVDVGERIFLHNSAANVVRVFIYTDSKSSARAATRRR